MKNAAFTGQELLKLVCDKEFEKYGDKDMLKECIEESKKLLDDRLSSKSYSMEPEGSFSSKDFEPQVFNPFEIFSDPLGIKKMSDRIPEVVDIINEKLPNTTERKNFMEMFTSFSSKIPNIGTNGFGGKTLERAADFIGTIGRVHPSVLVSIAVGWYAHDKGWLSFSFLIATAIYFIIRLPDQLGFLMSMYFKLSDKIPLVPDIDMDSYSPQFSDSVLELVGTLLATTLIGVVTGSTNLSTSAMVLIFVKDFSRARLGMIEIAKLVVSLFEKLVNWVRESFLNLPSVKLIDACSEEIDNFTKDVRLYCYKFNRGLLPVSETSYSSILCLLDIGKDLLRSISRDKFSEPSLKLIHEDCNSLKKILVDLERSDVSLRGIRQEPVGLLLSGGPGVAKSIASLYLNHILAKDSLQPEECEEFDVNPAPFIHSRKQENVYFDTLTNKAKVLFYDDLLQARDVPGNPACEAMEIIRLINTEEFNAHMAHLENKGNVYLRPRYVVATTNQVDLKSNAIVSSEAFKRRFEESYVVIPKTAYTMDSDLQNDIWHRRLDRSKLPLGIIGENNENVPDGSIITDLRPEHLWYVQYDLNTNTYGEYYTFEQVLEKLRVAELRKRKQFALHKQNFKEVVVKYAKIYDIRSDEVECPESYSFDPDEVSPQSGNVGEEEVTPYPGLDVSEENIMSLEIMLTMKPDYVSYLRTLLLPEHHSHLHALTLLLVDELDFETAVDYVENETLFPRRFKFKRYDKPKLRVRIFNTIKNFIEAFLNLIPSWQSFKNRFTFSRETVISIISFIAGSSILVGLARWLYSWWTGREAPQSFGFSDKLRGSKVHPKFVKNSQNVKNFLQVHPQWGTDTSGIDLMMSVVRRNCFRFEVMVDDSWYSMGTITFVVGRIGLIPYHFIVKLLEGVDRDPEKLKRLVRLSHGKTDDNNPGLLFTVEQILMGHEVGDLVQSDLVLVEFPRHFPERPSIIDKFATEKDLEHNKVNLDVMMPIITNSDKQFYFGKARRFGDVIGINKIPGYDYSIERSYVYDIPTKPGDCGSLMCILNPSLQKRKIFGVHVAGHDHTGDAFSGVITQDMLMKDLAKFETPVVCEEPEFISPQSADLDAPVRYEILGRTPLVKARNTFTSIVKSKTFGKLRASTLTPAMLRPTLIGGTLIDPLLNSQRKYCTPDVLFDIESVRKCVEHYFNFCDWVSTYEVIPRIFTLDEAIFGLEYDPDFTSISSSTSAGWPMSVNGMRNLKKEFFNCEYNSPEQDIIKDLISVDVNEIISKARKGIRMFHAFTDNNKDELREKEKYEAGATRLFSGCPFSYFLAFRQYFGAFSLWYMKNKIINGSAVGVNPYSSDWDSIAKRLVEVSPTNMHDGDHKGFDGKQKALIHLFMLDYINRWYGDGVENNTIRSILWMEVYNSRHVIDGIVYEWFSSLPSGHPFTIIINTIYNHIQARYTWLRSVGSLHRFTDNTYIIGCGDDIVYSVKDEYAEKYNDVVMQKYCKEIGLEYTNAAKTGVDAGGKTIIEIEFLKRSFVFDNADHRWIAPLHLKSVIKMVDWTKRKHRNQIVAQNIVTALRELSLHEYEVYSTLAPQMIKNFKEYYPYLTTSEPLEMDFRTRRDIVSGTIGFY